MIKRLLVENYQSIKTADLELGPLTLIVGQNFSGKSALLRAFHSLCFGKTGDEFIRHGEDTVTVELHTDDTIVTWEKRSGVSASYSVAGGRGNIVLPGKVFEKTGAKIPPEVAELIGIHEIEIAKDFIVTPQFQMQWDQPLVAEPGSKIARLLGMLTKLDRIVRAQMASRKDRDTQRKTAKEQRTLITQYETSLESLDWVEDCRSAVNHIQEQLTFVEDAQEDLKQAEEASRAIVEAETILASAKDLSQVKELCEQAQALRQVLGQAELAATSFVEAQQELVLRGVARDEAATTRDDARKECEDAYKEQAICEKCPLRI